jgi:hypothetical protein
MNTGTALTLASSSAARLVQLLGMLGSTYAGERATAGLKADELVKEAGLTWADVIRISGRAGLKHRHDHYESCDWHEMQDTCLRHADGLTQREYDFVTDLDRWHGQLTERQLKWLIAIFQRVRRSTEF